MARETQPPSGRSPASKRERLSRRRLAEHGGPPSTRIQATLASLPPPAAVRLRGTPERGAALEAPTAPHATAPVGRPDKLSGPARFWQGRRIRIVLAITSIVSLSLHWFVAPWNLLPSTSGLEFKDPAGELSIPVDLIGEEPPPPPEPPPVAPAPPDPPTPDKDPTAPGKPDAGPKPPKVVDAGQPLAASADAGAPETDGSAPLSDAGEADGSTDSDGGLVALNDAGGAPGAGGPRDPESMFGLTKVVNAGTQNVVLGVNVSVIRKHPVGSRMGPILQQIPQWKDFLKGAQSPVDPIRDTDWILIYGPSLIHTDRDAVLVRYNVSDDAVDATVASIARSYDKGGPFDAGVPGVKASLGHADQAQRVFLRPQSKLLVIVPPSHAHEAALTFRKQSPRGPSPAEAMRLIVRNPSNQISIPGLKFSTSLTEIRIWIVPRPDGSADVLGEGDCTDAAAATDSADRLSELLKRQNSFAVAIATKGLLNRASITADGSKVKLNVHATPEQLEAVLQLVAATVNAQIAPPSVPIGTGTTMPAPAPAPSPTSRLE